MDRSEHLLNFGVSIITVLDNLKIKWYANDLTRIMEESIKENLPHLPIEGSISILWDEITEEMWQKFTQVWLNKLSTIYPDHVTKSLREAATSEEIARKMKEEHLTAQSMLDGTYFN